MSRASDSNRRLRALLREAVEKAGPYEMLAPELADWLHRARKELKVRAP